MNQPWSHILRTLWINLTWALIFAVFFCAIFFIISRLGYRVFSIDDYWHIVQSCLILGLVIGLVRGTQGKI